MSQSRPFRDDPQSFRNTGIPRGNTKRYDSQDVMRMGGQKARTVDVEPVETEARKELRELAKRQADTDITLHGTLASKKRFVGSSLHQALKDELYGEMSLLDYQTVASRDEQMDKFRMLGLTDDEIKFKLEHESKEDTREGKVGANPAIIEARLKEINEKIAAKEEFFKQKDKFQPHKKLTRHEMDLEKSLVPNDPVSSKIGHLLVTTNEDLEADGKGNEITELLKEITDKAEASTGTESENNVDEKTKCVRCQQIDILAKYGHRKNSPDSSKCLECEHLQRMEKLNQDKDITATITTTLSTTLSTVSSEKSKKSTTNSTSSSEPPCIMGPLKRGQLAPWTKHEEIEEVPERILERFRLTLSEIKLIPKFANYTPGEPSKTLFLKNLSPKVTEYDLVSIFRRYEAKGSVGYRLLTGRMKGQAFITFQDVETATAALKLVNGYMLKDKPIIIQYGRKS